MLGYDYAGRRALLVDPVVGEMSPHLYILCDPCAESLRPPKGWILDDKRSGRMLFTADPAAASQFTN